MKYDDGMLILFQTDVLIFKCLVASHVAETGSLLIEPGAVIKVSDFRSLPGTRML